MALHPLYLAAIIPTLFTLLTVGGIVLYRAPKREWPLIGLTFLLELPLFFVSTYLLREPLNGWLNTAVDPASPLGLFLRSLQAPIIEEACKLWLVLLLFRFGRLHSANAVRLAMVVGTAFGVSEIWGLAYRLSADVTLAGHPFYYFAGFIQERCMVAPLHGVFVVAAARQLGRGKRALALGLLTEFALHYFANFPIFLARLDVGHLGRPIWGVLLVIYLSFYWLFTLGLLVYFIYSRDGLPLSTKKARCPGCQKVYARPLIRLNFGPRTTYEKCSLCKKYHWIYRDNLVDEKAQPPTP